MNINASEKLNERYEIIKRLYETYTGLAVEGLSEGLCMMLASLELEAAVRYEKMYSDAFLSTASLDALIKQKGQVVDYETAKKATGFVYVTGVEGTEISAGTEFESPDGNVYIVIHTRQIELYELTTTLTKDTQDSSFVYVDIPETLPVCSGSFFIDNIEKDGHLQDSRYYFPVDGLEDKLVVNINDATLPQVTLRFYYANVPCVAQEGGISHNKNKDDELNLRTFIENVNPTSRVLIMEGGEDAESYESYSKKCINHDRNPTAYFTTAFIRNLVFTKMPNILFLETEAGTDEAGGFGRGKVKLYVCDKNYTLHSSTKNDVLRLVHQIRPANMQFEDILIEPPIIQRVLIEIKSLNPDFEDMQAMIRKNLDDFFTNNLFFSETVSSKQIERVIYDSVVNGTKVIDFTLESGGYIQKPNTLLYLKNKDTDVSFT